MMVSHCCVPGCASEEKHTTKRFHSFPKDLHVCRLWLVVIRHRLATGDINRDTVKKLRVCSDHFSPQDYTERCLNKCLISSAVPSLFSSSHTQVFSKNKGTPTPASTCCEVEETSWRKVVKSLQTYQGTRIFKSNEVLVSTQYLLELFQYCPLCQTECYITIEGHKMQFSISQDCQNCSYHRQWRSHPSPADESVEAFSTQAKDLEEVFQEEHKDNEEDLNEEHNEDVASYPKGGQPLRPGDRDAEEVMIQIVSSDNEATEQNCTQIFIEKDGSYFPKAKKEMCEQEQVEKKKNGKRTCPRHTSLDEMSADTKDKGLFSVENLEKNRIIGESERQDSLDGKVVDSDVSKDEVVCIVEDFKKKKVGKSTSKQQSLDKEVADCDVCKVEGVFIVEEVKKSSRKRKTKRHDYLDEVFVDTDMSMDEDLFSVEEEVKRKTGKRKSKKQDSSDEWEPHLEAADSDVSMDENLFNALTEDDQGKVVMRCTVCKSEATLSCSLHHHKKVFVCVLCGAGDDAETHNFQFHDFPSFQKHAEQEHRTKPFRQLCQDCGQLIIAEPKPGASKEHVCEYKTKPVVCPECGKRFLTEIGLKRHFSKLHKDADHPCKYCLKLFKNRPSKLEHEQTHPKENQPYSCPDCPERFDNIHKRNSHLKFHRGPYKYACDICGKRLRDIIMLKRHKLIHSGEKPFSCQVCDRSFNQIGNLSSHMRLHTGEKPFMCEQCGECFNHNVSLKNHLMRYHCSDLSREVPQ